MVRGISKGRRTYWQREWIDYDDEPAAVADPRQHRIGQLPSGLLVVRRPKGYSFHRQDMEELSPQEFQLRLAGHRNPEGKWDPLRLFRVVRIDPQYIRVGRDPSPQKRLEWLARRGLQP